MTHLVIRGGDDPRVLVVKLGGPDIVQVAQKREHTPLLLVVPHLQKATDKYNNFATLDEDKETGVASKCPVKHDTTTHN